MNIFLDAIQCLHNLMQTLPHIENIYHLHFLDLLLLFSFLSNLKINIWTTMFKIYFMTFAIHQLNEMKNKSLFLIAVSKFPRYLERSGSQNSSKNFIRIIIRCKFCIVAPWVHYTLFFSIFWRNKVNCSC